LWVFIIILFVVIIVVAIAKAGAPGTGQSTRQGFTHPRYSFLQDDMTLARVLSQVVDTSVNIEMVISNYSETIAALTRLSKYEGNPEVCFQGELPSAAIARMQREKPDLMTAAVKRAYNYMLKDAKSLKTERGRENRKLKFFELLRMYADDFPPETNKYIEELIGSNTTEPELPKAPEETTETRLESITREREKLTEELDVLGSEMFNTVSQDKKLKYNNKIRDLQEKLIALEDEEHLLLTAKQDGQCTTNKSPVS